MSIQDFIKWIAPYTGIIGGKPRIRVGVNSTTEEITSTSGALDVNILSSSTSAGSLGKAEDSVHTSGDVGIQMLGVRKAATGPLSGTDGDYEPMQTDANGHLKVTLPSGAHTLTSTAPTTSAASPLATGSSSISFVTSSDFTGTINGIAFPASSNKNVTAQLGKTLPAIAYTVTAGTLYIDVLS